MPASHASPPHSSSAQPRAGWNKRFFAWAMSKDDERSAPELTTRKRALLADVAGDVIEIGPGLQAWG